MIILPCSISNIVPTIKDRLSKQNNHYSGCIIEDIFHSLSPRYNCDKMDVIVFALQHNFIEWIYFALSSYL